jgi:hypothetical protein
MMLAASAVSSPLQPQESKQVELLEGKLAILQEVVKELHHREIQHKNSSAASKQEKDEATMRLEKEVDNSKIFEREQTEKIENLNERLLSRRKDFDQEIEALKTSMGLKCDEKDNELVVLRENSLQMKEDYETEIDKLRGELAVKAAELGSLEEKYETDGLENDKKIAKLEQRVENHNLQLEKEIQRVKRELEDEHHAELAEKRMEIAQIQLEIQDYKKQIRSLASKVEELSEGDSNHEERIEIATAAVHAAEKRGEAASRELQDSEKRRKQLQVFLKLQQLTLQGLVDEMQENDEEMQQLKEALTTTKAKAAEAEVSLVAQPVSIWSRIKTRFSSAD